MSQKYDNNNREDDDDDNNNNNNEQQPKKRTRKNIKQKKIAFQGEGKYSFSALAIQNILTSTNNNSNHELLPLSSFQNVLHQVHQDNSILGIIPIETSENGIFPRTFDLLASFDNTIEIVGEYIANEPYVIAIQSSSSKSSSTNKSHQLERIFSHDLVFTQSHDYLKEKYPNTQFVLVDDTQTAAHNLEHNNTDAAICSREAAEAYNRTIIHTIPKSKGSGLTRYWLVLKRAVNNDEKDDEMNWRTILHRHLPDTGQYKTSIRFNIENRPGMLYRAIGVFAERGLNILKITGRPDRGDNQTTTVLEGGHWRLRYFIDIADISSSKIVQNALKHLKEFAKDVVIMGSYGHAPGIDLIDEKNQAAGRIGT